MSPPTRQYPFQWVEVPQEEAVQVFRRPEREYVKSVPGDIKFPKHFANIAEEIYNLEVRPDDVWLLTYPKCGTTWSQELLWQIVHNVDLEGAENEPHWTRTPFLEFEAICPTGLKQTMVDKAPEPLKEVFRSVTSASVELVKSAPSPRVIKSHLPLTMLPPDLLTIGCKVVFVCRNPKDTSISYFHHLDLFRDEYREDFDHFEDMFMNGTFMYGSYWYHLKSAWHHRSCPNLKIIWYEEMKKNFAGVIRELSIFLGHPLTEEKVSTLESFLNFDSQRQHAIKTAPPDMKPVMSRFFRKGQVGDWKNYFDKEREEKWRKWINENLEGTDIKIDFEMENEATIA